MRVGSVRKIAKPVLPYSTHGGAQSEKQVSKSFKRGGFIHLYLAGFLVLFILKFTYVCMYVYNYNYV